MLVKGHRMRAPAHPPTVSSAVEARRLVNDSIRDIACRFDPDGGSRFDFLCECGDLQCRELVGLTLREYDVSAAGSVIGHPPVENDVARVPQGRVR